MCIVCGMRVVAIVAPSTRTTDSFCLCENEAQRQWGGKKCDMFEIPYKFFSTRIFTADSGKWIREDKGNDMKHGRRPAATCASLTLVTLILANTIGWIVWFEELKTGLCDRFKAHMTVMNAWASPSLLRWRRTVLWKQFFFCIHWINPSEVHNLRAQER